jgi:hypothetical protein
MMNQMNQMDQNMAVSTDSLDLPPALASILAMPAMTPPMSPAATPTVPMANPPVGLGGGLGSPLPSFQEGGMVGPGGQPMGGMALGAQEDTSPMDPMERETLIMQGLQQNPQQAQEIQAAIMQALQSGELTPQELNMIVQLTQVAASNPEMYPYVRNFAIQNGIAEPDDLPEEYNEGLLIVMLTVAKAAQQMIQGGAQLPEMPQAGLAGGQMQSMAKGGTVKGKTDAPVPIMAHEGEYVIPKHIVQMKGREFFDSLVEKYKDKM